MAIVYLNRLDFKNAGDLYSSPYHYINKPGLLSDCYKNKNYYSLSTDSNTLIVGGGALLQNKKMINVINQVLNTKKFSQKILWGVGVGQESTTEERELINQFDLVGVRDHGKEYDFVPCASCMHPLFRQTQKPTKQLLIVDHWKRRPTWVPFEKYTRVTNIGISIENMIELIKDHEYIISSSYHAAYWGLLCNRKVLIVSNPMIPKLQTFHVDVPSSLNFDEGFFHSAKSYPNYYEECLELNNNFKNRVNNLIKSQGEIE